MILLVDFLGRDTPDIVRFPLFGGDVQVFPPPPPPPTSSRAARLNLPRLSVGEKLHLSRILLLLAPSGMFCLKCESAPLALPSRKEASLFQHFLTPPSGSLVLAAPFVPPPRTLRGVSLVLIDTTSFPSQLVFARFSNSMFAESLGRKDGLSFCCRR